MTNTRPPTLIIALLAALAVIASISACTGEVTPAQIATSTPELLSAPTATQTRADVETTVLASKAVDPSPKRGVADTGDAATTAPAAETPTVTPTATHSSTPAPISSPTPALSPTAIPTPTASATPTEIPLLLPEGETTTWQLPNAPHIVGMRDAIVAVLQANELEFDLGYPVQGFSPDAIYPRLFIRDTSTLMIGAGYFYPAERLKWGVETFLHQQYDETSISSEDGWQAGVGAISATVGPDGAVDKATSVSDEETHLIHAAYVVYQRISGAAWLTEEINDRSGIARLNAAGDWLLSHRRDEVTGLIKRDHTTDWGDVRFQPTEGNPTDIVAENVVWTASIYDQALAYRAWRELAAMNRAVGDEASAERWAAEAESLRQAVNAHLWQPERGVYRTHLHLTPLAHPFDEDEMVSIANAVAIVYGLSDNVQTASILKALENARLQAGAGKPGVVLHPPYPDGFFALSRMKPGHYQNGGVWDWWGGWQVLAEFEAGYSQIARVHLQQTAADWAAHPGQIFEWQEASILIGRGGEQYAGAAGVYAQTIIEGLYGARLSLTGPSLSPRLGDWPGSIIVRQPGSGLYLRYSYHPSANRLTLLYETNHPASTFSLRLLLPSGFIPGQVLLDDAPLEWERFTYPLQISGKRS